MIVQTFLFFTNHVASIMHRFWPSYYPLDYEQLNVSNEWIQRFKGEIPRAMKSTTDYVDSLVKFIDSRNDVQLWVVSALGQKQFNQQKHIKLLQINNLQLYVQRIGKIESIRPLPQMYPCYSFQASEYVIAQFRHFADSSEGIDVRSYTDSTIAFSINKKIRI